MHKKINERDIKQWLAKGNVQQLDAYWLHPKVVAYREKAMNAVGFSFDSASSWFTEVCNGNTFSFLMQRDDDFKKEKINIRIPTIWFKYFEEIYESSWGLLDVSPVQLRNANGVDTLDLLMRVGQQEGAEYASEDIIKMVCTKVHYDAHAFYTRFQTKNALSALAWIDNEHIWRELPRMANIMRHAAQHYPNDVLGAYLIWACDAGCKSVVHKKQSKDQSIARMQQLLVLSERVGLDTRSYSEHAKQCKMLYGGLGMDLTGQNILAYVQGVTMEDAPLNAGEELGALFV